MKPHPAWSPYPHPRLPLLFALGAALFVHAMLLALVAHQATPPLPPHAHELPVLQIDLAPLETEPPKQPEWIADRNQRSEEPESAAPELSPPPSPPLPDQQARIEPTPPPRQATPPIDEPARVKPEPKAPPGVEPAPRASLTDLALQSARLQAVIRDPALRQAADLRSGLLTANTREAVEAAYLRAWVEKVERIGNINYPDEIRRQGLQGRLILAVTLDPSGKVTDIRIASPSGQPLIDRAAEDIVRLAAPFAPFPADMRERYDQITIVRTWAFLPGRGLNTR